MNEYKEMIEKMVSAFNAGDLETLQKNFSQEIRLSRHSSSPLQGSIVHMRKALDQWIKLYPLTQVEYLNLIAVTNCMLLHLRILKHPEEVPFEVVFMLEIANGKVAAIDLILSEYKGSSSVL